MIAFIDYDEHIERRVKRHEEKELKEDKLISCDL